MSLFSRFKKEKKVEMKVEATLESEAAVLYQKMGQKIVDMIPVEWGEVHYSGEVEGKGCYSSVFYFQDKKTNKWIRSYDIPNVYKVSKGKFDEYLDELNQLLTELYQCFAKYNQEAWERIELNINEEGQFDMKYRYDIFEEHIGSMAREVIWAHECFGFVPDPKREYFTKLYEKFVLKK